MRYGSICSGIEAATVAWEPLGWKPVFFSEIDKFPSQVLACRYPSVPNLGDFTKIRPDQHEPIDLLVGETPCQDFSIAGLRAGMAGARGNLTLEFLRLLDRERSEWLLWENVAGVLSSNGGRDFGTFLGGLVELGYGWAYRVLDAQYVRVDGFERAVPQRRRRVFVVGHSGGWQRAAAVLFDRESLCWNSAPRRQTGKGITHDVAPCIGASGRGFSRVGETRGQDAVIAMATGQGGAEIGFGIGPTLNCNHEAPIISKVSGFDRKASGRSCSGDTLDLSVRRLIPIECERLQGFPDNHTNIPWRNRNCAPDGPRYETLGNSMPVNCMRWIGRRIEMVRSINCEAA